MVGDPCIIASLASGCYNCLSPKEKQALVVYFLAQALNGLGGTDLTNINTLREAVACFTCGTINLDSYKVKVAENAATGAVRDLSTDIADLRAAIKCMVCVDDRTLEAAEVLLRCKLNAYLGGAVV